MIWLTLLLQLSKNTPVTQGERIFAQSCSVGYCHGAAGAAARGPRLRDRTFDKNYLYRAIRDGIPKSAMPAWKDRLKEEEIWAVVAYVQSLGAGMKEEPLHLVESEAQASAASPAAEKSNGPPAAERAMELFFDSKGCGSCHSMSGRGTEVGPDLSHVPEEKLLSGIRSTQSSRVRLIKLKDGESFPASGVVEDGNFVRVFDLTAPPPVRRTLEKAEIESIAVANWSHQSVAAGYTPEQLADLVAYIRWAAR
jgi:mono/diheme cytochrome c family protein